MPCPSGCPSPRNDRRAAARSPSRYPLSHPASRARRYARIRRRRHPTRLARSPGLIAYGGEEHPGDTPTDGTTSGPGDGRTGERRREHGHAASRPLPGQWPQQHDREEAEDGAASSARTIWPHLSRRSAPHPLPVPQRSEPQRSQCSDAPTFHPGMPPPRSPRVCFHERPDVGLDHASLSPHVLPPPTTCPVAPPAWQSSARTGARPPAPQETPRDSSAARK